MWNLLMVVTLDVLEAMAAGMTIEHLTRNQALVSRRVRDCFVDDVNTGVLDHRHYMHYMETFG